VLVPIEYDTITNWIEYGPDGHYVVKNGKKGFVNNEGKLLIPCKYDAMSYPDGSLDLFRVKKDNKYGLIDQYNKPFLPITFNKLYVDIPFWEADKVNSKIVVQKMDSGWHYLSIKD